MYKYKVELDTMNDINEFVNVAGTVDGKVCISDNSGDFRVSAKSFLGAVMAVKEWDGLYLVADVDVYTKFAKFIH